MAKLGDYVSHIGIDVRPDFGHIQIFGRPDFGHLLATPILNFCDKLIQSDHKGVNVQWFRVKNIIS